MGERESAGALGPNSCPLVVAWSLQDWSRLESPVEPELGPAGEAMAFLWPWWQWGILRDPKEEGESGVGNQGHSPPGLDLDLNLFIYLLIYFWLRKKMGFLGAFYRVLKKLEDPGCFSLRK